ncbi:hypothetical protein GCM10022232_21410 [Streptomyces plumbiresistens]|uniref:Uncharacterized protein n=1 Tax=Streptomyces plumbiresistens TaxID=511811 RepID=A0ABP7QV16_9ACTN
MTTGDSSPAAADPWKISTRTFAPPGGDLTDIVVGDGSGAGRAFAAGPDISPAATTPAATVAAQARLLLFLVLLALKPRKCMGTSSVTATARWKLDLFAQLANTYDRVATNFVLSVDKRPHGRYRLTGSSQVRLRKFRIRVGSSAWTDAGSTDEYCWAALLSRHRCPWDLRP